MYECPVHNLETKSWQLVFVFQNLDKEKHKQECIHIKRDGEKVENQWERKDERERESKDIARDVPVNLDMPYK